MELNAKIPSGPIDQRWTKHQFEMKLVNPANKRKYDVIMIGSGLAGAGAAAAMGELGYNVRVYTYNDSARRAHSIAAQGGINAALRNMPEGIEDSVEKHTYDTIKGSDFLADQSAAATLCEEAPRTIYDMEHWGTPFSRLDDGRIAQRPFGGRGAGAGRRDAAGRTGGPALRLGGGPRIRARAARAAARRGARRHAPARLHPRRGRAGQRTPDPQPATGRDCAGIPRG